MTAPRYVKGLVAAATGRARGVIHAVDPRDQMSACGRLSQLFPSGVAYEAGMPMGCKTCDASLADEARLEGAEHEAELGEASAAGRTFDDLDADIAEALTGRRPEA